MLPRHVLAGEGVHVLNSYWDIKTCCVVIYDFQLIYFFKWKDALDRGYWSHRLRHCSAESNYLKKKFKTFFYILFIIKKLINKKYFTVIIKFVWFSKKYFLFILDGKYFMRVMKNLKVLYYLSIISNLVLKFFFAMYIYCFKYIFF